MEIERIKEDIIERYNLTWDEEDTMGLVNKAKEDFRFQVDTLIQAVIDYYTQGDPVY